MLPAHLINNPMFDQAAADKEVIASLWRALKGRKYMPELLKLEDGSVVRVHGEVEVVSQDELQAMHDELLREADQVNELIARPITDEQAQATLDSVTPEAAAPEAVPAPEVTTPAPEAAPAPVEAPAPAPAAETVPAPEVTVAEPVAPAAAEPTQPAPADVPVIQ